MSILQDLNKLEPKAYITLIILLLLAVPGFGIIFIFNEQLFLSLDIFKLGVLSVMFGLSSFAILYYPVYLGFTDHPSYPSYKKPDLQNTILTDAAFSFSLLTFWLIIAYYFNQTFKTYFSEVIITELIIAGGIFVASLIYIHKQGKKYSRTQ